MDVQIDDLTRSATRAAAGTLELNCERDEWSGLVDEDSDTVDGRRFGSETGRLLQILLAVGHEDGAARQSHLQLSLMV